ncbi:hypothetical protein [Streptomyces sp. AC550_RSS872]|uniref:hypothetical protein n=1 Tax=Streptomyces sp. AC550_RSS872 TaxID=2823689 RepID=UPI001C275666|nr:hypothetical protein [Streptomyces sp. AC550_RSS872]
MGAADAIALDGFLDEETVPGLHGTSTRFRIFVSPTDERTDEMVLPCTVTDPVMAAAVLNDLVPGDKVRVTGYFRVPRTPDEPMWLAVTALELLQTAPQPTHPDPDTGEAITAMLERYGPYVCFIDADTDEVPVWTETGAWVGVADTPADIAELLDSHEQRHGVGGD